MATPEYWAHSENKLGHKQTMKAHTGGVTQLAKQSAEKFEMKEEATLAGNLHDLGKYSDKFARRLLGLEKGLDHWSAGAWVALSKFKSIAAALAIQGHHIGLQRGDVQSLHLLNLVSLGKEHPLKLELTEADTELLLRRLRDDGFDPMIPGVPVLPVQLLQSASAMLDVRMLFSTLVDADFVDTETHMKAGDPLAEPYRPTGIPLQPELALKALHNYLAKLADNSRSSDSINAMRSDLMQACVTSAMGAQGVYTLTAPTGTGKTLAMLAFALEHAVKYGLDRIIVVLPFLSIIDQTARIYREIFAGFGDGYVLEHHSLSQGEPKDSGPDAEDTTEKRRQERLLTENWDAPIVITTSVQMLESMFASRPGACRKLHNIAKSVVLFDEVQTLPLPLAVPTLKALSRLAKRFHSSVVFATATQPAFGQLDGQVQEQNENDGWRPAEIVPASLNLYERAKRTQVDWSYAQTPTTWGEVAKWMQTAKQSLCIVNLKRHAVELAELLQKTDPDGLWHLSTSMCPAHRQAVLESVTARLNSASQQPCRLVSTQCVEAGVDVDFPAVFRAFGPLDAIAQAAGRCNRNDMLQALGLVTVFLPEAGGQVLYPPGVYEQAADVTRLLLREFGNLDIHDPAVFQRYYKRLYSDFPPRENDKAKQLECAIKRQDYVEVAKLYRLIENDSVNVLVCYNRKAYDDLGDEIRQTGLTARWTRKARPYVVSVFRSKGKPFSTLFEPIRLRSGENSNDWFIYCEPPGPVPHYNQFFGFRPPEDSGSYIV